MTTTQKIIRIGSSKGMTLPAKQLKELEVDVGDEVEVTIRKISGVERVPAVKAAQNLLERYSQDFENLAGR